MRRAYIVWIAVGCLAVPRDQRPAGAGVQRERRRAVRDHVAGAGGGPGQTPTRSSARSRGAGPSAACRTRAAVNAAALKHAGNGLDPPASALDQLLARRHRGNRAGGMERRRRTAADRAVRQGAPRRQRDQRADASSCSRSAGGSRATPPARRATDGRRCVTCGPGCARARVPGGARAAADARRAAVIAQPDARLARRRAAGCRRAARRATSAGGRGRGPSRRPSPDRAGAAGSGCVSQRGNDQHRRTAKPQEVHPGDHQHQLSLARHKSQA